MHQMTFQRVLAWCGIACIASFVGAFVLADFLPPLKPHSSAAEIADHYQDKQTRIQLGGLFLLISGLFYAAFTAVISAQMRRIPGIHPSAVYTQLAAGAFACLTYLVPALCLEVVAFRPERDIETTQTLNDMFWIFAVMPWTPFLTQNWAFAYAILTDHRERPLFPRWLAYVNIWCPLIFSPSVLLPFFYEGPFSWAGIFVFWIPGTVFIAQFICNVTYLLRAIDREELEVSPAAAHEAAEPDTIGATA